MFIYSAEDMWTATGSLKLDGMAFTAYDRDNDRKNDGNCAISVVGSWWYRACAKGKFTGVWEPPAGDEFKGIWWGDDTNLQYAALMIQVV